MYWIVHVPFTRFAVVTTTKYSLVAFSFEIPPTRDSEISGIVYRLDTKIDLNYTECPRRNLPDFGRVFLMLKYTDITQNTYVQI